MLTYNKKFNVWHEAKSNQLDTFKERELASYRHVIFKDKVVLDIGACAGSFSRLALESGAKEVISVEPHPSNISALKKNVPSATIIEKAAVADNYKKEYVNFYVPKTDSLTISSTSEPKRKSSRTQTSVSAVRFSELIEQYRPDVIKMDIEGAEFDMLKGITLPENIKEFVCEFHIFMQQDRLWQWWHDILYVQFNPIHWRMVKRPEWPPSDRCIGYFHGYNVNVCGWRRREC